jgi:DNA-binding transcriptional MocR family regulator
MTYDTHVSISCQVVSFSSTKVRQAVLMIASLYRKKTNVVFVENPTYFLALDVFRDMGSNVVY